MTFDDERARQAQAQASVGFAQSGVLAGIHPAPNTIERLRHEKRHLEGRLSDQSLTLEPQSVRRSSELPSSPFGRWTPLAPLGVLCERSGRQSSSTEEKSDYVSFPGPISSPLAEDGSTNRLSVREEIELHERRLRTSL